MVEPDSTCDRTITLSRPQPGNGVANGHAPFWKPVITQVVAPAPWTWTRCPIEKPLSIQDRPSRRVIVAVLPLPSVSIGKLTLSWLLPPPCTTVSPPCGPGQ
jgi:hypothetical protein